MGTQSDNQTVLEYQKRAVAFLESVVPADLNSEACQLVCQGRQKYKRYSGCADLAYAMYESLGLTHKNINRDIISTPQNEWIIGLNVSLLTSWKGVAQPFSGYEAIDGGDVLVCWSKADATDSHVACVEVCDPDNNYMVCAEYGQQTPQVGRRKLYKIPEVNRKKPWKIHIPLYKVLYACGVLNET